MLTAITNTGATPSCYTYNNSGLSDVYLRYGATALLNTSTPIQAYSVSGTGVTTWDAADLTAANLPGGATKNWADANTACAATGGRLPTLEELYTLSQASYTASTNTSYTPPNFVASFYWSSTPVPSTPTTAYFVNMATGSFDGLHNKSNNFSVRCVR